MVVASHSLYKFCRLFETWGALSCRLPTCHHPTNLALHPTPLVLFRRQTLNLLLFRPHTMTPESRRSLCRFLLGLLVLLKILYLSGLGYD